MAAAFDFANVSPLSQIRPDDIVAFDHACDWFDHRNIMPRVIHRRADQIVHRGVQRSGIHGLLDFT
jgi:hypothetical protein